MTADVNQNRLSVAINWIRELANGMNPIDGSILPDNDIVNNVHISRCLFFVSDILEDIGKNKSFQAKKTERDFQLTPADAAKVNVSEKTGIALFVKEINKVIPENMKPLSAVRVTQWLVSLGYLKEQERSGGGKYKVPTDLGISLGITSEWRDGARGQYLAVSYDANAQRFILENIVK